MISLETVLREHSARYPLMEPADGVKLVYQHTQGGGHMIADARASLLRLKEELEQTEPAFVPLTEELGGGLVRVNLAALESAGISAPTLNRLFVQSAAEQQGDREGLLRGLGTLRQLCAGGCFAFTPQQLEAYLEDYARRGYPAVSHSARYREAYAPAYRVVRRELMALVTLLEAMEDALARRGRVTVAIDGRAASGKTTLAARLAAMFSARVFHMDDYFLRPQQRTPQRLAEPGGNVDRERFAQEVLAGIASGEAFTYRPFDCSVMAVGEPVTAQPNPVTLVEGSYSLHPQLAGAYDLRVFVTVDPELQRRRILARNGERMLEAFTTRWIPLEERYFEHFAIRDRCDFLLENE